MVDQRFQFTGIVIGQTGDSRLVELLMAERPTQVELAIVDLAFDTQPVVQGRIKALLQPSAFARGAEQRPFPGIETAIELAEVIEGDARQWQGLETGP